MRAACVSTAIPAPTTTSRASRAAGSTTCPHAPSEASGAGSQRAPGSKSSTTEPSTTAAAAHAAGNAADHQSPDREGEIMAGLKGTKSFENLKFLKEVGDPATGEPIGKTEENLRAAVAGETYEYTQMYPGMAKTARGEGFSELAEWLETLAKAEKSHAGRFNKGLAQIAGKDPAEAIS